MTDRANAHNSESLRRKLLIVDDDQMAAALYETLLKAHGFTADLAKDLDSLKARLSESGPYDAILLDLELGKEDGLEGLAWILGEMPAARVYILTAHGSVHRAVEAMRKGASGFFEKGTDSKALIDELAKCQEKEESVTHLEHLGLIGVSEALQNIMMKVERLRDVDSTILLLGESGTGKEVIARAIHRTSKRAKYRFSAINCGAIPEALLESELFGHKRGAFTDAKADRKGIFEISSQGTLLLDEIGDMPMALQTKLLRVLQEREITPVGSSQTIKIDTRIIAATHRDILAEAESKRFREDLYYRLSIVVLRIPPLRERTEDIPLLIEHFLGVYNLKFLRDVKMPSQSDLARMMAYKWPGNIRELQNAMERAVVLSTNGRINIEDVFPSLAGGSSSAHEAKVPAEGAESFDSLFAMSLTKAKQAFERSYLEHYVKVCRGNVNDLAEKSGRYRADVYRLLNRYGIEHSEYRS